MSDDKILQLIFDKQIDFKNEISREISLLRYDMQSGFNQIDENFEKLNLKITQLEISSTRKKETILQVRNSRN